MYDVVAEVAALRVKIYNNTGYTRIRLLCAVCNIFWYLIICAPDIAAPRVLRFFFVVIFRYCTGNL